MMGHMETEDSFETACTCCGTELEFLGENDLCETCTDNPFATDRWAERDSILEHNNRLDGLDTADYIYPTLDPFLSEEN